VSDIPFYKTIMGKRFYEGTLPDLVTQLRQLNKQIEHGLQLAERLLAVMERAPDRPPPQEPR
jgi:hypothetical protein